MCDCCLIFESSTYSALKSYWLKLAISTSEYQQLLMRALVSGTLPSSLAHISRD